MNEVLRLLLLPLILSFTITYFATGKVIKFAKRVKIIDDPSKNKHPKVVHTYPVPRAGGLALFVGIFVGSLIFLPLDQHLAGILIGAIVLTALGLADDVYNLNPYLRFLILFLAAGIPILAGIGIAYINNPLGTGILDLSQPQINFVFLGEARSLWLLSDLFALLWIVFMMNMLNIGAKGVDGQLPGITFISALTIALLSFKYSADITEWHVAILASIVAGSYLGFLPKNIFPQKIMPGFSGSTLAGYMLAILSILTTTKVGTLLVVLGVPIFDTGYSIIRRIISGKSPFWGDRGHLHHKLMDTGLSKKQVSYIYWAATVILGIFALSLNAEHKLYTFFGIIIVIAGFLFWLTYRKKLKI